MILIRTTRVVAIALILPMPLVACSSRQSGAPEETSEGALVGVFRIDAGECAEGGVTKGSYFRMVQPGGNPEAGPFVPNGDSKCADKTFTPLSSGTDGGLVTGDYQPNPDPAFDSTGNGVAARLTQPQTWFAVRFSLSTNKKDPQTGIEVAAPSLRVSGTALTGDLRAFAASWNGEFFNQGSPKPDGSKPGHTSGPLGSYDPATKRFALDWSSQIVGGPFNNFTGIWHLEGAFAGKG